MKKSIFALFALIALLSGCTSDSPNSAVQYIPFQSEKDGRWGMISPEGKVLFQDEFSEQPTTVVGDRFFVRTKEGEYEMYAAEEKPKQVGDTYLGICPFVEDVTPAVKKGEPVKLIDRDGKEKKTLDKLSGKSVSAVSQFQDGYAIFQTSEDLLGAINTNGDVKIAPDYAQLMYIGEGTFIGVNKKYKGETDKEKVKMTTLDKNGKVIAEKSMGKFDIRSQMSGGVMAAREEANDERRWGLMNNKFEWVLKPSSKYGRINDVKGKYFIFEKDDKCGLADLEGNVIIRPKYDRLEFSGEEGILIAGDANKSDNERCCLINLEGEQVGTERFANVYEFMGSGKYSPVRLGENDYGFVDKKGELLKLDANVSIYDISLYNGPSYVESDYVDTQAIVQSLNITKTGLDGLNVGTTAEAAVKLLSSKDGYYKGTDPESYTYESYEDYTKSIKPVSAKVQVNFSETIAERRYRTEYEYWYGYTFSRQVDDGVHFNSGSKIKYIMASFSNEGKTKGKTDMLYKAFKSKVEGLGKVVKTEKHGVLVDLGNGNTAGAYDNGETACVFVYMGKSSDLTIPEYRGSEGGSGGTGMDDITYADSAVVDSVACDSAVAW